MVAPRQFDVCLVSLDPTRGSEVRKTRPCVVISPDELNDNLSTVIVLPMTSKGKTYPFRVPVSFQGKMGQILLDQMRTVDKMRLRKRLGVLPSKTGDKILQTLREMFA